MDEKDKREIEDIFKHHIGILSEDFQSKLDIVVEGHHILNEKADRMDKRLERVEEGLYSVEGKVVALDVRMNVLEKKVDSLDNKVDSLDKERGKSR